MVIDNIMLKFNEKLGGVNHVLSSSRYFAAANPTLPADVVKSEWFSSDYMHMGLDMSHSAPQSLHDRQAKVELNVPTFVGMAYTVGMPSKLRGTYWMQTTRLTYIQHLKLPVVEALQNYQRIVGRFPKHVVVFRAGVSEGEYRIVVDKEHSAFLEAFEYLEQENKGVFKPPKLTIIVVQRDSNYRIVPTQVDERARPADQNVRPGTCCDRRIMHPTLTEFLLVAHKAIQGTAKPIRCTVVADSTPRVPLQTLEYVTYHLCYAHGIVTSPVSVPAPLYAAADLSKRAHKNWDTTSFDGIDRPRAIEGEDFEQATQKFYADVSHNLKPTLPSKFWA